ncbi:hypothetical protein OG824_20550 [Streptomyces prunicolor]|uniref:hypothetical protein n=1 Tax=Streptomyces prunicolor TaxID=67348 RepID=UPI00225128F9|nr:hypothetical protein [Streptomyces prunicolor]MCX5237596.1 hypothetical protein [Streptomyces prunicolor]
MAESSAPMGGSGIAVTALFVEVLVVGVGASGVVFLTACAVFGVRSVSEVGKIDGTVLAAIGASVSYVLGIIIDRGADFLLRKPSEVCQRKHFESDADYDAARLLSYADPVASGKYEYSRSRMRVCRGWVLNWAALAVAFIGWAVRDPENHMGKGDEMIVIFFLLSLCLASYMAWLSIVRSTMRELAELLPSSNAG